MVYASIFQYVHVFIKRTTFAASPFQSSAYLRLTLLLIAINFESIKGLDVQKKKMHFEVLQHAFCELHFSSLAFVNPQSSATFLHQRNAVVEVIKNVLKMA